MTVCQSPSHRNRNVMLAKKSNEGIPGAMPGRSSRNRPPFPNELPGKFVVIEFNRDTAQYKLHVDDSRRSSYDLGGVVQGIMNRFEQWGYMELLCNTLDLAREFGAAQGVFKDGRTIALFDRDPVVPPLFPEDIREGAPINLPT